MLLNNNADPNTKSSHEMEEKDEDRSNPRTNPFVVHDEDQCEKKLVSRCYLL